MSTVPIQSPMVTEAFSLSVATTASTDQDTSALSRSSLVLASRSEPADWCMSTRQAIASLGTLEDNWDSYGGRAIKRDSIRWASALIDHLATIIGVTQPTVTATGEGLVALCWDAGSWSLDVEVSEIGVIEYVYLDERDSGREIESSTRNPLVLARYLAQWV